MLSELRDGWLAARCHDTVLAQTRPQGVTPHHGAAHTRPFCSSFLAVFCPTRLPLRAVGCTRGIKNELKPPKPLALAITAIMSRSSTRSTGSHGP